MRGIKIGLTQFLMRLGIEANRAHKAQRLGDPVREFLIAGGLRAVLDEAKHPAMRVFKIGIAARGKSPKQVQGCRRLPVSHQLATGVGFACAGLECEIIHDVPAIARQLNPVDCFGRRRTRLGELAGDAAELHHRQGGGESCDHGHLQKHPKKIPDIVGGVFGKTLGAVAALQKKSFARGNLAQHALQFARLAREDQRWKARELTLDLGQRCLVGIIWYLLDRFASPTGGRPAFHGHVLSLLGRRPNPCEFKNALYRGF